MAVSSKEFSFDDFQKGCNRSKARCITRDDGFSGGKRPRKTQFPLSSCLPLPPLKLVSNAIRIDSELLLLIKRVSEIVDSSGLQGNFLLANP